MSRLIKVVSEVLLVVVAEGPSPALIVFQVQDERLLLGKSTTNTSYRCRIKQVSHLLVLS